jgi:hypothetical protein
MQLDMAFLTGLVRETLARPRDAATRLLGMDVPDDGRWLAFVLVVVLSVILGQASVLLTEESGSSGSLLIMAVFHTAVLVALVVGVQGIGRMAGGKGSFPDVMLLITWLQFVMLVFQILQIVALVAAPPLFGIVTIFSLLVFLRTLTVFVQALHGFESFVRTGVAILFSFFGVAMLMSIVLIFLGYGPVGAM